MAITMGSFLERVGLIPEANDHNCTYTLPPLRDWPSEILHTYGLNIFLTPFSLAAAAHIYWCCLKWCLYRHKPYGRIPCDLILCACPQRRNEESAEEKDENVARTGTDRKDIHQKEKTECKRRATFTPTTAILFILGFMLSSTQYLACRLDGCAERATLRTPTVFLLVLACALLLPLPLYASKLDEAVLARLPESLVYDDRADSGSSEHDAKTGPKPKDKKRPLLDIGDQDPTRADKTETM